jgi:ATP-binding cassette subfamily F protein 3
MVILSSAELKLSFGEKVIFDGVSFSVNEGDRLGIVGVNGAGKTSLLKILTGELEPSGGSFFISGSKKIGVLSQNVITGDAKTSLEFMYTAKPRLLEIEARLSELENENRADEYSALMREYTDGGGAYYKKLCESTLARVGFEKSELYLSPDNLSGGQRTRLVLARLLMSEPDILMLDEPTNHLDIDSLIWLEGFLSGCKQTIITVSHDRYFLDRVTNKTLIIENTHGFLFNGGYSVALEQKEAADAFALKQYEMQEKEIKRIQGQIAKQIEFGQERNYKTIASREKMIERLRQRERPDKAPKKIKLEFSGAKEGGSDVINAKGLSMSLGGRNLFSDLSFLIKRGEFVFFSGRNGSGKSTLVKLICGQLAPTTGKVTVGHNIIVGYYDQENQGLNSSRTVIDELWSVYPRLTESEIRSRLAAFLFRGDSVYKPITALSGGERARLSIAKLIGSGANLLLLDEPTNHLDIPSKEALEGALLDYDGTIAAVSHDRYFIDRLASRIIEPSFVKVGNNLDIRLDGGGYEEYTNEREKARTKIGESSSSEQEKTAPPESAAKSEYLKNKAELAEKRKTQKKLANAIVEIPKLEAKIEVLKAELFGSAASDYKRAAELSDEIAACEDELMGMYEVTEQ